MLPEKGVKIEQLMRIRDCSGDWKHADREGEAVGNVKKVCVSACVCVCWVGGDLGNKNANPEPENRMTIDSNYIFPL